MIRRIALWAILISVAAASSGAAALHFWNDSETDELAYEPLDDCPTHFDHFQHAVVWQAGGKRLLIQAQQACGDKFGHTYELEKVTVSIVSENATITKLESSFATLALAQNKIVLGSATESPLSHCIGNPELMEIDLVTSEVRMPGRRFLLNSAEPLACNPR